MKADEECKCNGWKNPNPPPNPPKPDAPTLVSSLEDLCRGCNHKLGDHVSHLEKVTGVYVQSIFIYRKLNRFLGMRNSLFKKGHAQFTTAAVKSFPKIKWIKIGSVLYLKSCNILSRPLYERGCGFFAAKTNYLI